MEAREKSNLAVALFLGRPGRGPRLDGNTSRTIPVRIPDDPILLGFRLHLQASVIGSNAGYRSNAVSRIVGE
jgi:hypothetical protein